MSRKNDPVLNTPRVLAIREEIIKRYNDRFPDPFPEVQHVIRVARLGKTETERVLGLTHDLFAASLQDSGEDLVGGLDLTEEERVDLFAYRDGLQAATCYASDAMLRVLMLSAMDRLAPWRVAALDGWKVEDYLDDISELAQELRARKERAEK